MNDNYCFVYPATIAIFHKEIGDHPERTSSKLLKYAYKFDWNGIYFPASTPDYKRFRKYNEDIALNILYVPFNEQDKEETVDVLPEYISKFNFTRKKHSIIKNIKW